MRDRALADAATRFALFAVEVALPALRLATSLRTHAVMARISPTRAGISAASSAAVMLSDSLDAPGKCRSLVRSFASPNQSALVGTFLLASSPPLGRYLDT